MMREAIGIEAAPEVTCIPAPLGLDAAPSVGA